MEKLNLKFKGDRGYLHGTDFFEEISKRLNTIGNEGSIRKLAFKSFAINQCFLVCGGRPDSVAKVIGSGVWQESSGGKEFKFWVVEGDVPVTDRYAFDEEKLVSHSVVEGDRIFIDQKNEFSVIENAVALTKKLNYELTPQVDGKWVFGQIDLDVPLPENFNDMEIKRTSERQGKFSCNVLTIDSKYVGEIRFIVGRP